MMGLKIYFYGKKWLIIPKIPLLRVSECYHLLSGALDKNRPYFRPRPTTSRDEMDHVSGQNRPCFRAKLPRLKD